jgi:exodeoxyribonuclease V alpha subunit
VVQLTEVFRQAAQSRVIVNAHRINRGQMPELDAVEGSDFFFVDAAEPEEGVRRLLTIVCERIPTRFGLDPIRDVQVLCPMNRGGLGARSLNLELQQALNPPGELRVERFGWTLCPGDKVMQVTNDYDRDVFNGDLGVVIQLTTQHYAMLARNLLYTGVTRGKRLVVLVGQRRALVIAMKNQGGRRRWSKLHEWLGLSVSER